MVASIFYRRRWQDSGPTYVQIGTLRRLCPNSSLVTIPPVTPPRILLFGRAVQFLFLFFFGVRDIARLWYAVQDTSIQVCRLLCVTSMKKPLNDAHALWHD